MDESTFGDSRSQYIALRGCAQNRGKAAGEFLLIFFFFSSSSRNAARAKGKVVPSLSQYDNQYKAAIYVLLLFAQQSLSLFFMHLLVCPLSVTLGR